jgi:hypothetical protein
MQLRRPYVLRHRITGAIKHSFAVSGEEGGLWEMLLTDGSPEANRLASMEESSPRVRRPKLGTRHPKVQGKLNPS